MKRTLVIAALLGVACNGPDRLEPVDPMAGAYGEHRVTVLGTIKGFNLDDPRIDVEVSGRTATVTVSTYGDGCYSRGETQVQVNGLEALIVPWDNTAPAGTTCTRQLVEMRHQATLQFDRAGTAHIRVRGLDASTRHAGNMVGDTITVERVIGVS